MKKKNKRAMVAYYSDILFNTFRNIDMAHFIPLDNKLQKLIVAINPVQDLHGYDNPWPSGGGKNLLPLIANGTFTIGSTGASAKVTDGKIELTGTTTASGGRTTRLSEYFTLKAGTYIISPALNSSPYVRGYLNKKSDNTVVGTYSGTAFTISEDTEVYYGIGVESGQTYNQTFYPQVESGSNITSWTPYSNICPITGHSSVNVIVSTSTNPLDGTITNIPLGQTVYGGTLDVVRGVLTVEWVSVDMGTLTYQLHSNTSVRQGWQIVGYNSFAAPALSTDDTIHAISSEFKSLSYNATWPPYIIAPQNNNGSGAVVTFPSSAYSTGSDVATALEGVQLVYELATAIEISLTPQQINTIVGSWNYVWCDTGKIILIEA